jgi:hypothetical protein
MEQVVPPDRVGENMTENILPLPDPIGGLLAALAGGVAGGALGYGVGHSQGVNLGYNQRDQELMPFIDSLRRDIIEERRLRQIAQRNVVDYYEQLEAERRAITIINDRVAKLEELLAENEIEIP